MIYQNAKPIAILLAVYNGEKYLAVQVDSILNQTNQEWVLYIRNDGSTDSTQSIIDKYIDHNLGKIIQVGKGDENIGCRLSFFSLFEQVQSNYYMFCDADDSWLPEKIELSFSLLQEKEKKYPNKALLIHTDKVVCDEYLNVIAPSWWNAVGLNPDLFHKFLYIPVAPVVGGATSIFNKIARDLCLPIPKNVPQHDCWVPLQTAKYGKIFALHNPLILYRQHGNNTIGASIEPYRFKWNKFGKFIQIMKRDYEIAKYFKEIGYGCIAKYFWARGMVFIKLQWSKITYK